MEFTFEFIRMFSIGLSGRNCTSCRQPRLPRKRTTSKSLSSRWMN